MKEQLDERMNKLTFKEIDKRINEQNRIKITHNISTYDTSECYTVLTFLKWSSTANRRASHSLERVTIAVKSVKSSFSTYNLLNDVM
jgi:hypothetical protein